MAEDWARDSMKDWRAGLDVNETESQEEVAGKGR